MKEISSFQNPLIKQILQLKEKSRERKKTHRFIVEGLKELQLALKGDYEIETVFFDEHIIATEVLTSLFKEQITQPQIIKVSSAIYQKIAYRTTTEGIIAIGITKPHDLKKITFKRRKPLILIAETPEKPGNIGALLRTADAANLDAVIIANPKTDLYNPNIIRSSVGCIFTNQIATGSTTEVISFLKENNIPIYCAALTASIDYHTINFEEAAAIVVGTEASGLGDEWLANSDKNIIIPMQGEIDSMNVSVSAAILIFEAKRQRNFL